jgi:hypothetical protein
MGVGVQRHAPAAFTPGKDPVPIVREAGWTPGPVWTGAENLAAIICVRLLYVWISKKHLTLHDIPVYYIKDQKYIFRMVHSTLLAHSFLAEYSKIRWKPRSHA